MNTNERPAAPVAEPEFDLNGIKLNKEQALVKWNELDTLLAQVKDEEMKLRMFLTRAYLPDGVKEGTQKAPLANGWVLNVQGKMNRKIDPALIAPVTLELKEKYPHVSVDSMINYKPELSVTVYKTMTEEERTIFEQMLIITPGAPTVEIVKPKRAPK